MRHLLVLFLLHLNIVSPSFISSCFRRNSLANKLIIDGESYRHGSRGEYDDGLIVVSESDRSANSRILRKLYEIIETGDLNRFSIYLAKRTHEIFYINGIYRYTPAEWAIYQSKMNVLEYFMEESLLKHVKPLRASFIMIKLLSTAIKAGNFPAFQFLRSKCNFSLEGNDFLNLAMQHQVRGEFLNYLLDDCGLVAEIEKSGREFNQTPLETAIKFNNFAATYKLIRKTRILPIQYIMTHNKIRFLDILFDKFKSGPFYFDCNYRTSKDGNLFHMAAKYSSDPEMMNFLLKKCPNIPVDGLNVQRQTPLDICLEFKISKKEKIAEILILNGAEIFLNSVHGFSPMEKIVTSKLGRVFKCVLDICIENAAKLQKIIEAVFNFRAWSLLDEILLMSPHLIDTSRLESIPLVGMIKEKAHVTLDLALEMGFVELDHESITGIVLSSSIDLIKVALKRGADPQLVFDISERKKIVGRITDDTYDSIIALI